MPRQLFIKNLAFTTSPDSGRADHLCTKIELEEIGGVKNKSLLHLQCHFGIGIFYIVDFHPVLWMVDDHFAFIKYDYFNTTVIGEVNNGTYADRDAPITTLECGWNHPFSEVVSSLIKYGLKIIHFHEFPYSPSNCFNNLEQGADGNWRIKGMHEKLPMLYSIKAIKEA